MSTQRSSTAKIDQLPVTAASTVKQEGWRGIMRLLSLQGRLLITNHNHPEAVILSTIEHERLTRAAGPASATPD